MSDMVEIFPAVRREKNLRKKLRKKLRKEQNLSSADSSGWTKHTKYHWSREINGLHLDYWPSTRKFQYNHGPVFVGDVEHFIKITESKQTTAGPQ